MAITKRGNVWYCNFVGPDGRQVRKSLGTQDEQQAKEAFVKIQSDLWRIKSLGEKPKVTFDALCVQWLTEKSHKKSLCDDKYKIRFLRPLLKAKTIDQWTAEQLRGVLTNHLKHVGPASLNRYVALLRSMWRMAERHGFIDKTPLIRGFAEPKRRIRWLTQEEASRLMSFLPPHWAAVAKFALATGLRKGNVFSLRWEQIDLARRVAWIHADQAKAGRAIGVPLNQTAMSIIREQIGKNIEHVFSYRGKPMNSRSHRGWDNALKAACISNFRFHDLRHTWASWLVQAGVGLAELQEMGGWESISMVRRYAHLAPDHLQQHAEKLDSLIKSNSTKIAHEKNELKRPAATR